MIENNFTTQEKLSSLETIVYSDQELLSSFQIIPTVLNIVHPLDINEHKRTVNRISFHPTERDILISGSQDGTMRYFVSSICTCTRGKAIS